MNGEKIDWEIQRGEYIEQLQTENQRLREALEGIAAVYDMPKTVLSMARNALQKEG